MRSPHGISVGLGVAALVLTAGLVAASPARAQPSAPGCVLPCDAAEQYLGLIGYLVDFSPNPAPCRSQCADLRKGCVNTVAAAERCFRGSSISVLDIAFRNCADIQGSGKQECTDEVNGENQALQSLLKDNVQCGKEACEDAFQECLLSCQGPR